MLLNEITRSSSSPQSTSNQQATGKIVYTLNAAPVKQIANNNINKSLSSSITSYQSSNSNNISSSSSSSSSHSSASPIQSNSFQNNCDIYLESNYINLTNKIIKNQQSNNANREESPVIHVLKANNESSQSDNNFLSSTLKSENRKKDLNNHQANSLLRDSNKMKSKSKNNNNNNNKKSHVSTSQSYTFNNDPLTYDPNRLSSYDNHDFNEFANNTQNKGKIEVLANNKNDDDTLPFNVKANAHIEKYNHVRKSMAGDLLNDKSLIKQQPQACEKFSTSTPNQNTTNNSNNNSNLFQRAFNYARNRNSKSSSSTSIAMPPQSASLLLTGIQQQQIQHQSAKKSWKSKLSKYLNQQQSTKNRFSNQNVDILLKTNVAKSKIKNKNRPNNLNDHDDSNEQDDDINSYFDNENVRDEHDNGCDIILDDEDVVDLYASGTYHLSRRPPNNVSSFASKNSTNNVESANKNINSNSFINLNQIYTKVDNKSSTEMQKAPLTENINRKDQDRLLNINNNQIVLIPSSSSNSSSTSELTSSPYFSTSTSSTSRSKVLQISSINRQPLHNESSSPSTATKNENDSTKLLTANKVVAATSGGTSLSCLVNNVNNNDNKTTTSKTTSNHKSSVITNGFTSLRRILRMPSASKQKQTDASSTSNEQSRKDRSLSRQRQNKKKYSSVCTTPVPAFQFSKTNDTYNDINDKLTGTKSTNSRTSSSLNSFKPDINKNKKQEQPNSAISSNLNFENNNDNSKNCVDSNNGNFCNISSTISYKNKETNEKKQKKQNSIQKAASTSNTSETSNKKVINMLKLYKNVLNKMQTNVTNHNQQSHNNRKSKQDQLITLANTSNAKTSNSSSSNYTSCNLTNLSCVKSALNGINNNGDGGLKNESCSTLSAMGYFRPASVASSIYQNNQNVQSIVKKLEAPSTSKTPELNQKSANNTFLSGLALEKKNTKLFDQEDLMCDLEVASFFDPEKKQQFIVESEEQDQYDQELPNGDNECAVNIDEGSKNYYYFNKPSQQKQHLNFENANKEISKNYYLSHDELNNFNLYSKQNQIVNLYESEDESDFEDEDDYSKNLEYLVRQLADEASLSTFDLSKPSANPNNNDKNKLNSNKNKNNFSNSSFMILNQNGSLDTKLDVEKLVDKLNSKLKYTNDLESTSDKSSDDLSSSINSADLILDNSSKMIFNSNYNTIKTEKSLEKNISKPKRSSSSFSSSSKHNQLYHPHFRNLNFQNTNSREKTAYPYGISRIVRPNALVTTQASKPTTSKLSSALFNNTNNNNINNSSVNSAKTRSNSYLLTSSISLFPPSLSTSSSTSSTAAAYLNKNKTCVDDIKDSHEAIANNEELDFLNESNNNISKNIKIEKKIKLNYRKPQNNNFDNYMNKRNLLNFGTLC